MGRMIKGDIVTYAFCKDGSWELAGLDNVERQYRYRVSNLGVILWKAARDFYLSFEPPAEEFEAVEVSAAEFVEFGPQERRKMKNEQVVEEVVEIFKKGRKKYLG